MNQTINFPYEISSVLKANSDVDIDKIESYNINNENRFAGWQGLADYVIISKKSDRVFISVRLGYGEEIYVQNLVDFIYTPSLIEIYTKEKINSIIIVYLCDTVVIEKNIPCCEVDTKYLNIKEIHKISHIYIDKNKLLDWSFSNDQLNLNPIQNFATTKNLIVGENKLNLNKESVSFGLRTKNLSIQTHPKSPLISVITPSFNSSNFIEQTIQSVINQSYQNVEFIIIDGGSKDNTLEILKKYEDYINLIICEPDKGIYDAINKGTLLSQGEYSVFIGSDDIIPPDAIEFVANSIVQHESKPGFFYGDMLVLKQNGSVSQKTTFIKSKKYLDFLISHPSLYIKKTIFEEINGFDIRYTATSDADFELKLITGGYLGIKVNYILSMFREGGVSFLNKNKFNEGYHIFRKHKAVNLYLHINFIKHNLAKLTVYVFGKKAYSSIREFKNKIVKIVSL